MAVTAPGHSTTDQLGSASVIDSNEDDQDEVENYFLEKRNKTPAPEWRKMN